MTKQEFIDEVRLCVKGLPREIQVERSLAFSLRRQAVRDFNAFDTKLAAMAEDLADLTLKLADKRQEILDYLKSRTDGQ